jgi:hypothetical protein
MWTLLGDSRAIRECQRRFSRSLSKATTQVRCFAGFQGGHMPITANWSDRRGVWFATQLIRGYGTAPRYWNALGTTEPEPGRSKTITCEINFPIKGIDRRVGGGFAVDDRGDWHVVHRGNIGGGRQGIGRSLFFHHFRGEKVSVHDGDEASVALIGDLDSPRLASQIALFAKEVERIKALVNQVKAPSSRNGRSAQIEVGFTEEPTSRRGYRAGGWRQPSADHGLVVNALAKELERLGFGRKVGSDMNRDLFIVSGKHRMRALFEVKSAENLLHIYEAIGQLLYHSADEARRPLLVLVSPALSRHRARRLHSLRAPPRRLQVRFWV